MHVLFISIRAAPEFNVELSHLFRLGKIQQKS
jgi:hypothetical protein